MSKTLDELRVEFQTADNRNEMLMQMAWACRREGRDRLTAEQELCAIYDAYDVGAGRGSVEMQTHHAEVRRAVEHVYDSTGTVASVPKFEAVKVDKGRLAEWHRKLNDGDWQGRIKAWIEADAKGEHKGLTTGHMLSTLFRNAEGGYVAYYGRKDETHWVDTVDWSKYDELGNYYTLQTFRDKTKRDEQNAETTAVFVIEIDHPHDAPDGEQDAVTEEEKKTLRLKNLEDTCRLLDAIGIPPTSITFSGKKSWHVAWRLTKPVPKATAKEKYGVLRDAIKLLGADPAMVSIPRASRIPRAFPSAYGQEKRATTQHCVYFDADAETDYETLTKKLVELAEEVNGGKLREAPDLEKVCPLTYVEMQDADGNLVRKLAWKAELWEPLVRELGVFKYYRNGNPSYVRQDKEGLYSELNLQQVSDYILIKVGEYKPSFKAKLREKRDCSQARWYSGINGSLNPIKDSRECVTIPFRGTLARVTKDGISISQGYCGYSIPENSPTIHHELEWTEEECEYEVFLRHACGELEDNPEWIKRYDAFRCLAGYLVSQAKEHTNWMIIISDESKNENEGGTGKSIYMSGIAKVVETEYRDERKATLDGRRFEDSDWSPTSRILWRDEIPEKYDWARDFATASGGKSIELKGRNERIRLGLEEMQKLVYCTNFYPKGLGASFERRRKMYELSNHYNPSLSVEKEFGHMLISDWDEAEYNRFYCFILRCVRYYLQCGSLIESGARYAVEKTETANISADFVEWYEDAIANDKDLLLGNEVSIAQGDVIKLFGEWYLAKYGRSPDVVPRNKKNQWLKVMSEHRHISMEERMLHPNGKGVRYWVFRREDPVPFQHRKSGTVPPQEAVQGLETSENSISSNPVPLQNGTVPIENAKTVRGCDHDDSYVNKGPSVPSTVSSPCLEKKEEEDNTRELDTKKEIGSDGPLETSDPFLSDAPDSPKEESLEKRLRKAGYLITGRLENADGIYLEYKRPSADEQVYHWQKEGEGIEHDGFLDDAITPF